MTKTVGNYTGDGIVDPIIQTYVEVPDSGTTVNVTGTIYPIGGPLVSVTGSPISMPAAPGSGQIFWIIQVNASTGAATVKQSTSATPLPDPGNVTIFSDILNVGEVDPTLNASDTTPDSY